MHVRDSGLGIRGSEAGLTYFWIDYGHSPNKDYLAARLASAPAESGQPVRRIV